MSGHNQLGIPGRNSLLLWTLNVFFLFIAVVFIFFPGGPVESEKSLPH